MTANESVSLEGAPPGPPITDLGSVGTFPLEPDARDRCSRAMVRKAATVADPHLHPPRSCRETGMVVGQGPFSGNRWGIQTSVDELVVTAFGRTGQHLDPWRSLVR